MTEEYVSRNYVLKCLEDSWKNAGIPHEAKSKFTKWLMKAPAVIAPKPMEKPLTNADRIRGMTDEELAKWYFVKFFPTVPYCRAEECQAGERRGCIECLAEWLKEESEGE